MRRVQLLGAGILAMLALVNMAGHAQAMTPVSEGGSAGLTAGQQASADWYARAALRQTTTEPRAFDRCIMQRGTQVFKRGVFVGRECVAPDGERWYAGLVFMNGRAHLNTGP